MTSRLSLTFPLAFSAISVALCLILARVFSPESGASKTAATAPAIAPAMKQNSDLPVFMIHVSKS